MVSAELLIDERWSRPVASKNGEAQDALVPDGERARAVALCQRVASGDGAAFEVLVREHQDRILSFCARLLGGDRSEAEDLAQDVFLSVYRHAGEFRGESSLTTWLYRIAKNQTLNRIKYLDRRGRGAKQSLDDVEPGLLADGSDPLRAVVERETVAQIDAAILELPEQQRVVLVLRDVEGLAYEDITEITGLALGTVKSRIHRARTALAQKLSRSSR